MKRVAIVAASALMGAAFLFAAGVSTSYAAKVDCSKVMDELNGGKSAKDVAKDLGISTSSVYRCKRHAKAEAKAGTKTMNQVRGEAVGSPAAMPSGAASAASSPAAQ
jgi:Mor family transcriptional regulator